MLAVIRGPLISLALTVVFTLSSNPRPNAAELTGFAVLPAETFADGPPSGQFDADGLRAPQPRFASQPVQGFSAIQRGQEKGTYWVLSDNGFGTKANSPDYLLCLYLIRPSPKTRFGGDATVQVVRHLTLCDPGQKTPFRIVNEAAPTRPLTGSDFDVESFAFAGDGTIWAGDEFGPFLLHFDASGRLLEAPIPVPDFTPAGDLSREWVRSPQNPAIQAKGVQPGAPGPANLPTSGGFEGLAVDPAKRFLYALLEKSVAGDPPGRLRLYQFDLESKAFTGDLFRYELEDPGHAIGEMTAVNARELLVIERDNHEGPKAAFKKIFLIELHDWSEAGPFKKTEVADLLQIADPDNLAGSGPVYRMPYWTIEAVLPLDAHSLLVANDNNFDMRGARGEDILNANEIIWIRIETSLNLP